MKDRIIDIEYGPYATTDGVYVVALVMDENGNTFSDEIYYNNLQDCYDDISEMIHNGWVELDEDELEEFDEEGDDYDG